ncbi:hypothetical protein [Paracandidimonas soli]|uniref:Uncharacterized protein n=1 Tax=Paracandidimonas soli TaxID=1917182 RepID=A0A4V2VQD4_9BURK|nr:hypothetical protein [Paracandidimonas soli]TCU93929.1 hypothetical protein EV686_11097 [Paracandidimonas soli]
MDDSNSELIGPRLERWLQDADTWGAEAEEKAAMITTARLLRGAMAVSIDALERPSETAVLAVFREVCLRSDAPLDEPIRTLH